jgi:acetyltransferase-like isoleucine patch superfamily enzyme
VVFGAGGHARSVVDVLERLGESVVAVVGDAGGREWHVDRLTDEDAAIERVETEGLRAVVAIGAPEPRMALLSRLLTEGQPARTARTAHSTHRGPDAASSVPEAPARTAPSRQRVAPVVIAASATVAPGARLGPGTVVLEHAHVGPSSRIGSGVIVNTGAIVEHDCVVGDGSHVAPGALLLGAARIGNFSFLGSGARVLPGIELGAGVTVGAGAVVTRAVPAGVTVVGVPARVAGNGPGEGGHS